MTANTSIPPDIADTIIAIIIYFAAISAAVPMIANKIKRRKAMLANKKGVGDDGEGTVSYTHLKEGKSAEESKARWKDDVEKFKVQRKPYLLYEE